MALYGGPTEAEGKVCFQHEREDDDVGRRGRRGESNWIGRRLTPSPCSVYSIWTLRSSPADVPPQLTSLSPLYFYQRRWPSRQVMVPVVGGGVGRGENVFFEHQNDLVPQSCSNNFGRYSKVRTTFPK